jgi:hypothetical protein
MLHRQSREKKEGFTPFGLRYKCLPLHEVRRGLLAINPTVMVGVGIREGTTEGRPNSRVRSRFRERNFAIVIGVQSLVLSVFRSSLQPLPVLQRDISLAPCVIQFEYPCDVPVHELLFRNSPVLTLIDSCGEVVARVRRWSDTARGQNRENRQSDGMLDE